MFKQHMNSFVNMVLVVWKWLLVDLTKGYLGKTSLIYGVPKGAYRFILGMAKLF